MSAPTTLVTTSIPSSTGNQPNGGASQPQSYWPELDGFRVAAFLCVFFKHGGPIVGLQQLAVVNLVNTSLDKGEVGVDLFFALSGFLITTLLCSESERNGAISLRLFYIRRMLRIWPLYYLVLLVAFILLPIGHVSAQIERLYRHNFLGLLLPFLFFTGNFLLAKNTPLLSSISILMQVDVARLIFPLWSLCIEEQFYAVWPVMVSWLKKKKLIFVTLLIALASPALRMTFWQLGIPYYYNTITNLDSLMWGALVALAYMRLPKLKAVCSKYGAILAGMLLILILLFATMVPGAGARQPLYIFALNLVAPVSALLVLTVKTWPPLTLFFSARPLVALGKLTYAAYLFHYFILSFCDDFIWPLSANPMLRWAGTDALALLVTFAAAALSWLCFEGRFNQLRKRFRPA